MADKAINRVNKGLTILSAWDGELELDYRPGSHHTGVNPHGHGGGFAYILVSIPFTNYHNFMDSGDSDKLRELGWVSENEGENWIFRH